MIPQNYWDSSKLKENSSSLKKIFFFRICGTGMCAVAYLLQELGYIISGGDYDFYPPIGDFVNKNFPDLYNLKSISAKELEKFDLIVVGNVVSKSSKEAEMLLGLNTPITSFANIIGGLIAPKYKNVIGVAGTHGKTTTVTLLVQILKQLNKNPGFFVGGITPYGVPSDKGSFEYLILEADEYDSAFFQKMPKFHFYALTELILTSIELDHLDIYKCESDYNFEFEKLLESVPGTIIYNSDYSSLEKIMSEKKLCKKKSSLAYGGMSQIGPKNIEYKNGLTYFSLDFKNDEKFIFSTNLVGVQNVLNLSSCLFMLYSLENYDYEVLNKAIKNLKLPKRRQEIKGEIGNTVFVDDFAHHPRAAELTMQSVRLIYPNRKLVCFFAPHSATARSNFHENNFIQALQLSDEVIILKPKRSNTIVEFENLNYNKIAANLEKREIKTHTVDNLESLVSKIKKLLDMNLNKTSKKQVFLFLSNGDLYGLWDEKFIKDQL